MKNGRVLFIVIITSLCLSTPTFAQLKTGELIEIQLKTDVLQTDAIVLESKRPELGERLFYSNAVEQKIAEVEKQLKNPYLRWMFQNCFPNTLDTTVYYRVLDDEDDTFVYTGDIHAMWLRDSAAQVYPYVFLANEDEALKKMLRGVILRHQKLIILDPYANAFSDGDVESQWKSDRTLMRSGVYERKWEIDSLCYPIRLAYAYWKETDDESVFGDDWIKSIELTIQTFREQQRKENLGPYRFLRVTDRQHDTVSNDGYGSPIKPVGLIVSSFRPSDDSTVLQFLVPSNFFAVSSLRKAGEILQSVHSNFELANECVLLANEVEQALRQYAIYDHPKYGEIYAYEVDGFGNHYLSDDSNVPSLLSMAYLGDVNKYDPIYQNTRNFVWSDDNPYFFRGEAGEGIGGPHIGYNYVWPMSIMMKAFTSDDDEEIKSCIQSLMNTDAGTGFMHESFHKDDATKYTRDWFAWQNTLFGELIIKLIDDGKLDLLNSIEYNF